jgi:hypothetical protein
MKRIRILMIAFGVSAGAAPASLAQGSNTAMPLPMSGKVTPEKVKEDLKRAEAAINKYEDANAKMRGKKVVLSDPALSSCLKNFTVANACAKAAPDKAQYPFTAVKYQACEGLIERTDRDCLLLAPLGADAVADCKHLRIRFAFARSLGQGTAEAQSTCMEMLGSPSNNDRFSKGIPASIRQTLCSQIEGGADHGKIAATLRSTGEPLSDQSIQKIMSSLDSMTSPGFKCPGKCSESLCCDAVATSRARRAKSADACGDSAFCRAAFGETGACDGLYDDLAKSYCETVAPQSGAKDAAGDAQLNALFSGANSAVAQAMMEAEALEPHSDEDNSQLRDEAHALRKKLNDIPKWIPPVPAQKKKAS